MTCPRCTQGTKVTNSRRVDSPAKGFDAGQRAITEKLVGTYTPDWVARTRTCIECGHKATTIEVYAEDLEALIKGGLTHGA